MGLTRAPILATVNYSSYPSAVLQLIQCTEYMLECYSLPVIRVQCVECVLEDVQLAIPLTGLAMGPANIDIG